MEAYQDRNVPYTLKVKKIHSILLYFCCAAIFLSCSKTYKAISINKRLQHPFFDENHVGMQFSLSTVTVNSKVYSNNDSGKRGEQVFVNADIKEKNGMYAFLNHCALERSGSKILLKFTDVGIPEADALCVKLVKNRFTAFFAGEYARYKFAAKKSNLVLQQKPLQSNGDTLRGVVNLIFESGNAKDSVFFFSGPFECYIK